MKTTTENKTATFADLLRSYETYAKDPKADPTAKPLTDLATAVAYSVLNKCIDVSQNPALIQTRRDLTRDLHNRDRIAFARENSTETRYNSNGDPYTFVIDKNLYADFHRLCSETLGEGVDLVGDAEETILSETKKAKDRNGGIPLENFMETPYKVRRLKKKVWIKTADSINGWETTTTTAIQEVFKAVRRTINNNKSIQTDPHNGYTYLADVSTDPESGTDETIFRRFGKYADIGGTVTDYNGKEIAYTADEQTAHDLDNTFDVIIEKLSLTDRQAQIINLRLRGYGYKAIGTYLGVTKNAVINTLAKVQKKCEIIGFTPTMWAEMTTED